jgi:hypothetical protein
MLVLGFLSVEIACWQNAALIKMLRWSTCRIYQNTALIKMPGWWSGHLKNVCMTKWRDVNMSVYEMASWQNAWLNKWPIAKYLFGKMTWSALASSCQGQGFETSREPEAVLVPGMKTAKNIEIIVNNILSWKALKTDKTRLFSFGKHSRRVCL